MNRRIQIAFQWLLNNKNNLSLLDIVQFLISKNYVKKSVEKIEKIEKNTQFIKVYFKNFNQPLYFPAQLELNQLYMVIAESFYKKDWHYYEIEETQVQKNDIVVDCGAAEGLFSLLIANRCQKVFAIEPLPIFVDSMKETFSGLNNVEIVPKALSNTSGMTKIKNYGISSNLDDTSGEISVEITTIDQLFYEKNIPLSYIKADLEGYEIKMLEGAYNTIKFNKPKIAITTYHDKNHTKIITEYLKNIDEKYNIITKGIDHKTGTPVMLHAYVS